jgi:hypothetical protein
MRLINNLSGRRDKKTCVSGNYVAKDERELDSHMKKEHTGYQNYNYSLILFI